MTQRSVSSRIFVAHLVVATSAITVTVSMGPGLGALIGFIVATMIAAVLTFLGARAAAIPHRSLLAEARRSARDEFATLEEQHLHEIASREQILSSMGEAVVLLEGETVVYSNQAARALLGEAVARIGALVTPVGDEPTTTGLTIHHPTTREVRAKAIPVAGGRTLVVAQDVTESLRTERMRRDFVANASHELKTPLAGILATAETLQSAIRDDAAAAERFALALTAEAERMSRLIADLLDLARLEAPETQTTQPLDLSAIVSEQIAAHRSEAAAKAITVRHAIDPDVRVVGRREDVAALPRNLIENAIRYTPAGGSIDISLRREGDRAVFAVRDSGVGIPSRDLPRVFERFYRVDRARARETGGTGLGLAIVKHVAESMDGTVAVQSETGAGSTFTVTLPSA